MRVFVTGATGFIGSKLVRELIGAGHQVIGLTRSDEGARALEAAGAEPHRGTLGDSASLSAGAANADGVVHLAFNHDFSTFAQNCEDDRRVIVALGEPLVGTDKPFLITSGTAVTRMPPGQPSAEDAPIITSAEMPRAATEEEAQALIARGVHVSIVRLPQVHDTRKQGLISPAIEMAVEKGVFPYVGDGQNRWPAAHVDDVARLYRLALERAERGAIYHAVAEEGIAVRNIAETIGRRLGLPARSVTSEEAPTHYGWLAMFVGRDLPASSARTRALLGWEPTGPTMLEDLARLERD